jgi:hypothetical protein
VDAIHLPNAITLPTTFGAPGTPLSPGQLVQALVLALIESDVFRLQLPQATVDVRSDVALTPGSTITVAAKGTGANARLVIYSDDAQPAAPPASRPGPAEAAPTSRPSPVATTPTSRPSPPANLAPEIVAGKHPIGEAIIIGRVAPGASAKVQTAPAQTAILRDAPSITPPANAARVDAPRVEPSRIVSPQQALGDAVRSAAVRQSGLAPLIADIEQAVQLPPNAVPPPVRAAAVQLLALRVPLDQDLAAADVKQAFVRSGVLLESKVAAETRAARASPSAPTPTEPLPSGDLKAALIVFRQVLKAWSSESAPDHPAPSPPSHPSLPSPPSAPATRPIARPLPDATSLKQLASALAGATGGLLPVAEPLSPEQATSLAKSVAAALHGRDGPPEPIAPGHARGPPPPYRGAPLSAQQPAAPSIAPDTPPHETAERLLGAADGAIARTTLLQAASLPDQLQRIDQGGPRWTFEVPFMTPQGTGVAQFEVSRDGRNAKSDAPDATWRARFSLDLEPMGPVHAMIALSGPRTSVTLWAERAATAAQLNEQAPLLNQALRAAELEPADFQFRVGTPPVVARPAAPGRFMDRAT